MDGKIMAEEAHVISNVPAQMMYTTLCKRQQTGLYSVTGSRLLLASMQKGAA